MDDSCAETPIEDLLRSIPLDARMIYEHSPICSSSIPVGSLARKALTKLEQLTAERDDEHCALIGSRTLLATLRAEYDALQAKLDALPKMYSELKDNVPDHKSYEGYAEGWVDACNECEWGLK
jgi:hypothetical protein